MSKLSSGICSPVFGMDIEKDIANVYTTQNAKRNGKSLDPD